MALDPDLRSALRLPVVAAPMTSVTTPELVIAAMNAGVMAALPSHNARSIAEFDVWLGRIRKETADYRAAHRETITGPLAVNLAGSRPAHDYAPELAVCAKHDVDVIISAMGNPTELARMVHEWGGRLFHDVTTVRFADKAIEADVDGLICVSSGGGGHSGLLSPFVFVPLLRKRFAGTIILAGAVSSGYAVRAAEVLGADLAYLGTRFIATKEASVHPDYHRLLVESGVADLVYTPAISAVPASWLKGSLELVGLDPNDPPVSPARGRFDHLPEGVRPWHHIWSAGQGVALIDDVPSVPELVERIGLEYAAACATLPFDRGGWNDG
jgi:nitronate monooxygenase